MNFSFFSHIEALKRLYDHCREAETFVTSNPSISVASARKAIEFVVKLTFAVATNGKEAGYTVFEMLTDDRFTAFLNDPVVLNSLHYIRKMGNAAVHDGDLQTSESLRVLEELHFVVGEVLIHFELIEDYPPFVKPGQIPTQQQTSSVPAQSIPSPTASLAAQTEPDSAPQTASEPSAAALQLPDAAEPETVVREAIAIEAELIARFAPRMRLTRFNVKHRRDERENQRLFLLASLREAGWPVLNQPNQLMPGCAGFDRQLGSQDTLDFVLTGRDYRPLAIIEEKTTTQNLIEGRKKAIAQAEQLSVELGYRPVVYYTNGYHIYCIDQLGYPPRRVFQFHTLEELELLKLRQTMRQDISDPSINETIINRDYQKAAVQSACQAFSDRRRSSLIVMATGTGKTRVSIAMVDVLMRAGWIKNALFLADRTSLIHQAHKNFNKLLPNVTTSVYVGARQDRDAHARIIFSTYQTMINLINDDTREFGMARFDLIIIDEAHRSIFKKYGALFRYFDALMLGLTATPRNEENKSTYQVFKLSNGMPDYAYELKQAIEDRYLVGFTVLDRTTEKMRRGIVYDELSDDEKAEFEDTFIEMDDTDAIDLSGTVLDGCQLGRSVINLGTIDAMLNDLMKHGLKINGADELGKTIIFAGSHVQAEKIVERFQHLYRHLDPDFCKLIDSRVDQAQQLIDLFGDREGLPRIAVSVDMMDTGIDVPDVLNLVFFKTVRSKIKFLQMIGRGTRLSPDIFGPGMDKKGFLIFDYHDNFRFFAISDTWMTTTGDPQDSGSESVPQSQQIHDYKLRILRQLQETSGLCAFDARYRDELKAAFIGEMRSLNNDDIQVQYNMAIVSKYRTAENWDALNDHRMEEITKYILPLLPSSGDPVKIKSFDLLMLAIEHWFPQWIAAGQDPQKIRHGFRNIMDALSDRMSELLKLKNIPAVVQHEQLIHDVMNGQNLIQNFSLERAEHIRTTLRGLMPFIPNKLRYYIIDVPDVIIGSEESDPGVMKQSYAEKAQDYLRTSGHPALTKLRGLQPLTEDEKADLQKVFQSYLGTPSECLMWTGQMDLLPFLRLQMGIADEAIQSQFGSILNDPTLSGTQTALLQQIVTYVRENGDMRLIDLQHVSPFCDLDLGAVFGNRLMLIKELINGLHQPLA